MSEKKININFVDDETVIDKVIMDTIKGVVNDHADSLEGKAGKSEIPDVSGFETSAHAAATYQPKGNYASEQDLTSLSAKVGKVKLTPADLQDEDGVYMLDLTSDELKYKSVVVDFTGAAADATICALICDESGAPIFEGEAAIYCKGGAFIGTDSESAKVYGSTPDWDNTKTYLCVIADNSVVYAEEEAAE